MLVAIIADVHDNLPNLDRCLSWCREHQVEKLIACGDLGSFETVEHLALGFSKEIFLIRGNADNFQDEDLKKLENVRYGGLAANHDFAGVLCGYCHQPEKISLLSDLSGKGFDYIFYGHTHKPWIKQEDKTYIANPGTLGGIFYPASFAVLDTATKKLELKILADL